MSRSLGIRRGLVCLVIFVTANLCFGDVITAVWQGSYGDYWDNPAKWSCGTDPQNSATDTYNVEVNSTSGYYLKLNNSTVRTVETVSLGSGTYVEMRPYAELYGVSSFTNNGQILLAGTNKLGLAGGTFVNNGMIRTLYDSYYTSYFVGGTTNTAVISGTGEWQLAGSYVFQGNVRFDPGVTIRNMYYSQLKSLGLSLNGTIDNRATITLERKAGTTDIVQLVVNQGMTNTGRLEAVGGALIYLYGNVNNAGGVVDIDADSNLHVSVATLSGGDITGAGNVYVYGQTTPTRFQDVTIASGVTTHIRSREQLEVRGTLTNNGTIRIGAATDTWNHFLIGYMEQPSGITHGATIDGTGSIIFTTGYGSQNNDVKGYGLTLGSGQTITTNGTGTYGDIWTDLLNYGMVNADGGRIDLGHHGTGAGTVTNHGTLKAGNGGTLYISQYESEIIDNTGGSIIADAGSTVMIYAGGVDGGVMGGSGTLRVLYSGMEFTGDLAPGSSPGTLRLEGDMVMSEAARLILEINGTDPGEFDVLDVAGSLALNGEMAIILGAGYDPAEGDTWEVITGLSNTTGGFLSTAVYRQGEAEPFAYCDAGESDGALVIGNIQEIPEPTTLALLLAAAGTFAGRRRRRLCERAR